MKVGIEIGGTFTDLIAVDDEGAITTHKVSTTPDDPAIGSFQGLEEMAIELSQVDTLLHGSTIATNAVLERRGATTGLLTTRGFRDVLMIQRFDKKDSYNPFYKRPEPLIPRSQIEEITERVLADGAELLPLIEDEVVNAVKRMTSSRGITSLAICFLHGYLNQDHEVLARDIIAREFPALDVSVSSDVLPKLREYERTSTTVISAYVKPVVDRYLREFELYLQRGAFSGAFLIMQANGGVIPSAGARGSPASMYLSGPAAGVVGAEHLSRGANLPNLLTLDVGGTSTDVALITNGRATITSEGEIGGLAIGLPLVDISSVGAGGGSIAWCDAGGMLRVGPQSAGARPGPACYGRGGKQPTLTDALLVLGLIPADRFLGGRMALDAEAAQRVVKELATRYQMTVFDMAESIVRIGVANITQATRLVSIKRGHDPRRYAICAYGGVGPLLAALVADELSVLNVVVPPNPGLFSAFGLLVSDFKRDFTQSRIRRLSTMPMGELRDLLAGLRRRAVDEFTSYGLPPTEFSYENWVELRYEGQGYELSIPISDDELLAEDTKRIRQLFNDTHLAMYGHNFTESEIVAISYRVSVTASRQSPRVIADRGQSGGAREGRVYFGGTWDSCSFHFRSGLQLGSVYLGPAVISEDTATTFIPAGWAARLDTFGNVIAERAA